MNQHDESRAKKEALERVERFVSRAKILVESISVEDLIERAGVNPYMVKSLGMKTIEEIVDFSVQRKVERSLGTSFGNVLDDVIKILLGGVKGKELSGVHGNWIKWWDIALASKKVVISVKSGPADMNKDQVEYFAQRAREASGKGFIPYLVFAYGKQAFPVIDGYLRKEGLDPSKHLRIGKAVFDEFLGKPDYYTEVLEIFSLAGEKAGDIFALVEEKITKLTEELKERYKDVDEMLEDMF